MDKSVIEKLKKDFERGNIEMFFCESGKEAKEKIFSLMADYTKSKNKEPKDVSVSFGGSVTLHQIGVRAEVENYGYDVSNPAKYQTPAEQERARKLSLISDIFLCGANAISENAEIINIDGNGNRVASLICGPDLVIIAAGVNKIVKNAEDGYKRIKDIVCPKNAVRLAKKTPCATKEKCFNCFINGETICSHTVITRRFSQENRVKLILINEELGY